MSFLACYLRLSFFFLNFLGSFMYLSHLSFLSFVYSFDDLNDKKEGTSFFIPSYFDLYVFFFFFLAIQLFIVFPMVTTVVLGLLYILTNLDSQMVEKVEHVWIGLTVEHNKACINRSQSTTHQIKKKSILREKN